MGLKNISNKIISDSYIFMIFVESSCESKLWSDRVNPTSSSACATTAIMSVHLLTTSVVHGLLLLLEFTHFFSNDHTLWNWTNGFLAPLGVNAQ